jgi:peroxiredoxin
MKLLRMKPMKTTNPQGRRALIGLGIAVFLIAAPLAGAAEPVVGQKAPDFTFTAPDGGVKKLSDYRGKPVALHFWTSWCGPCIRELPLISQLTTAESQRMTVLAINCAETGREVSAFLTGKRLSLNVVMDKDGRISGLYNIYAIPQTYLIDAEGFIKSVRVGAYSRVELNRDVSALLGR